MSDSKLRAALAVLGTHHVLKGGKPHDIPFLIRYHRFPKKTKPKTNEKAVRPS